MSTKSTIYYQGGKVHGEDNDYLHIYYDMGGHQEAGFYVDTAGDVAKIEDPLKLADALKRILTVHEVNVR